MDNGKEVGKKKEVLSGLAGEGCCWGSGVPCKSQKSAPVFCLGVSQPAWGWGLAGRRKQVVPIRGQHKGIRAGIN